MSKIASNGGIGNRLRTMIGYAAVYKTMGRPMPKFVWLATKHAPPNRGAFRICGVDIEDATELDDKTVMVPGTIDIPLMFRTHDLPSPTREQILDAYRMIEFSPEVMDRVRSYALAVHLRMGDVALQSREDDVFRYLARNRIHVTSMYLACDDKRSCDRIRSVLPVDNFSTFVQQDGLRETSVFDAAVDMAICIEAAYFSGSRVSSFTQMIDMIRRARRKSRICALF